MRSGNGATIASARSASIAWTTAEPTSAGDRVGIPMGAGKPVSAHIPASRIGPGYTTDTPKPRGANSVYAVAAGGKPEDWATLDHTMAAEGHTAVLVRPRRIYSNPA